MCRLAYVPFNAEKEDTGIIETLFEFLELSFGGQGNGIGYFVDRKPWTFKGSNLDTEKLVGYMVDKSLSAIFHTRLASMGSICNENTHPFSYNGVLTAHNGHWSDSKEMAKMLIHADKFSAKKFGNMTDSEVIACMVGNYGFGVTDIVNTGVILSLYNDHAKVFVEGDFEVIKTAQGQYIYASEFPSRIISDWKVKEYYRFERGSVAKLTEDGPILIKGGLSKTAPSAWPTKFGQMGVYPYQSMNEWYEATRPPRQKVEGRLSFLPKRRGKKAKKKPYTAREILWEVQNRIGFDKLPDIDVLLDTSVHSAVEDSLTELEDELIRVLSSRPHNKHSRRWLADEANNACISWLRINKSLLNEYGNTKLRLESSFLGDENHGDSYTDSFGNLWVFFHGEWLLFDDLDEDQKEELVHGGDGAEWIPLMDK